MQERGRFVESILRIKKVLRIRLEQESIKGSRLGEKAPDVTLSPDYKTIHANVKEKQTK